MFRYPDRDALTALVQKIKGALDSKADKSSLAIQSNPNLLDNWYFGSPVNQRAQTSYKGATYTVDRWYINNESSEVSIVTGGVKVQIPGSSRFREKIERLEAGTYTFSVLQKETTSTQFALGTPSGDYTKGSFDRGLLTCTVTLSQDTTNPAFGLTGNVSSTAEMASGTVIACKLEQGDIQTLARLEGDKWVLNDPPPNYEEELARCQRFQYVVTQYGNTPIGYFKVDATNSLNIFIPVPTTMRAAPTAKGTLRLVYNNVDGTAVDVAYPTEFISRGASPGCVRIQAKSPVEGVTNCTVGYADMYTLEQPFILDANL